MNSIVDKFLTFSSCILAGQEGAFFTDGDFVDFKTGESVNCDFDSDHFPIFSATDFLGEKSVSVYFEPVEIQNLVSVQEVGALFDSLSLENFKNFEDKTEETESSFIQKGEAVQAAQKRGEMWVMNLTHRLSGKLTDRRVLLAAYYRFLKDNPSHMGGVFWTKDLCFVSFSPELFIRQNGNELMTCPIKGTGSSKDLETSTKEKAELYMVTDLLRNDLGQISEKVWVETEREMISHGDFSHASSMIKSQMSNKHLLWEDYEKLLPAGSISGCPKARVIDYIKDLEGYDRGFYTGTFGVRRSKDESVFNILIRTFFVEDEKWGYPVGAGITHKSDLSAEWRETLVKAVYLQKYLANCL